LGAAAAPSCGIGAGSGRKARDDIEELAENVGEEGEKEEVVEAEEDLIVP
jgi:hypothetical protein